MRRRTGVAARPQEPLAVPALYKTHRKPLLRLGPGFLGAAAAAAVRKQATKQPPLAATGVCATTAAVATAAAARL